MFRSGCTFGVDIADEFSEGSLDLERSPLLFTDVEKCLEDATREELPWEEVLLVAGTVVTVLVVEMLCDTGNLEVEWLEK